MKGKNKKRRINIAIIFTLSFIIVVSIFIINMNDSQKDLKDDLFKIFIISTVFFSGIIIDIKRCKKKNKDKLKKLEFCNSLTDEKNSIDDEDMMKSILKEKEIEDRMYCALEHEEFEVYLQAKYSINEEICIGAEALVRWNIPNGGVLGPSNFIPIFEKNGFIVNLDMYIFDKVCSKINEWKKEGLKIIPVSVNMSRIHIRDVNCFIESISKIFEKYNIESELIEIEITESALFEDTDMIIEAMLRLKKIGFVISLDDFGAGYSSLNILKDLPIDVIKLDKKFLDSNGERKAEIVISNIVKMAKELNLVIVAEGVETHDQAMFLMKIGCNIAQGYLYSIPMPINEFEEKELKK